MKPIGLVTLTLITAAIAIPATADTVSAVGGVDLSIDSSTAAEPEKIETDVGVAADTGADVDADTSVKTATDFTAFDQDKNGFVSQAEFAAKATLSESEEVFTDLDANGDGKLSKTEFALFAKSTNDASGGLRDSH